MSACADLSAAVIAAGLGTRGPSPADELLVPWQDATATTQMARTAGLVVRGLDRYRASVRAHSEDGRVLEALTLRVAEIPSRHVDLAVASFLLGVTRNVATAAHYAEMRSRIGLPRQWAVEVQYIVEMGDFGTELTALSDEQETLAALLRADLGTASDLPMDQLKDLLESRTAAAVRSDRAFAWTVTARAEASLHRKQAARPPLARPAPTGSPVALGI